MLFIVLLIAGYVVNGHSYQHGGIFKASTEDSPMVFESNRLPEEDLFYPTVGNGHIGYNINGTSLFVNGIYNGERGLSHRASVPVWINAVPEGANGITCVDCKYRLDVQNGIYEFSQETDKYDVTIKIYAHKYFTRALVYQYIVTSKGSRVKLIHNIPQQETLDISFGPAKKVNLTSGNEALGYCGQTKMAENSTYQTENTNVCVYWTEIPSELVAKRSKREKANLYTFVMTVDTQDSVAKKEISDVLSISGEELYELHVQEWTNFWKTSSVDVQGNPSLAGVVYSSLYYLASSLPSTRTNQPPDSFNGLSPGGLSRGAELEDYQGHIFWDTETWMYPPILLLWPDLARELLQYRVDKAQVAEDLAQQMGYKGIRFPWESAFTGYESTPACCPEVSEYEHHVTGDVAFAFRQYLSAAGHDRLWIQENACEIIYKMAEFWASRTSFNQTTRLYDINHVMGPDEDHFDVNNSVFTNVIAGYSLYLGQYAMCLCNGSSQQGQIWADMADRLKIPYDPELDYHPEFDGYAKGTIIKQGDAVLLGFPLQYKMNQSTMRNDLSFYEQVTRIDGPAMTWSMHAIGHLDLDEVPEAEALFQRSYEDYVREPFKVWSESRAPTKGAVNFLTGMGGFLQAVIMGYGGVRLDLDGLRISKSRIPLNSTALNIRGLKYMGASFDLNILPNVTYLYVNSIDKETPLAIHLKNNTILLEEKLNINLSDAVIIKPVQENICLSTGSIEF